MLEGKILVTRNDGTILELTDEHFAGDGVELLDGILCPGFINCHCHMELSHMKGMIPEHTGLVDFILKVVNDRHFEEEAILNAIESAEAEMLQNGIVAVGDICNNLFTLPQKRKGNLYYHNFIEASGFTPEIAASRFKRSLDFYNEYITWQPASIVPHAPYSVSPELFQMIINFPGNRLLTIHNQEEIAENYFFQKMGGDFLRLYDQMKVDISFFKANGKTSLDTFYPYLKKEQSIILVHNVVTSKADLDLVKNGAEGWLCLCPNANLYIGNQLPDVELFIENNCKMVIGTDSLASNHQLSILEELKILQSYFPKTELAVLLKWATLHGATALGIQNDYGSFEKGKKPGIVLIDKIVGNKFSTTSKAKRIL